MVCDEPQLQAAVSLEIERENSQKAREKKEGTNMRASHRLVLGCWMKRVVAEGGSSTARWISVVY